MLVGISLSGLFGHKMYSTNCRYFFLTSPSTKVMFRILFLDMLYFLIGAMAYHKRQELGGAKEEMVPSELPLSRSETNTIVVLNQYLIQI